MRGDHLPPDLAVPAMQVSVDCMVLVRADGSIAWANDSATSIGWDPSDLVGRPVMDLIALSDHARWRQGARAVTSGYQLPSSAPFDVVRSDGSLVECDVASWTVRGSAGDGDPGGVVLHFRPTQDSRILRDLLHRLLADEPTVDVLASLVSLVYHRSVWAHPVVTFADEHGDLHTVGDVADPLLNGLDPEPHSPWTEVRSGAAAEVVTDVDDLPEATATNARVAGFAQCWVSAVQVDGEPVALVTIWSSADGPSVLLDPYSVTLLRQLVELVWRWWRQSRELRLEAVRDPLTGLPNRRALAADRSPIAPPPPVGSDQAEMVGVLFVDLDHFKPVNDTLGHAAGDEVLQVIARRLLGCVRPEDLVVRLGGDEFGVVIAGCTVDELDAIAHRIVASCSESIPVAAETVAVSASVGAAHGEGPVEALLDRADAALYRAKAEGRRRVAWA